MVNRVLRDDPGAELDDAAQSARRLYESYGSPLDAVQDSHHARDLHALGLGDDVHFCAQLDVTGVVPELSDQSPWPLHLTG
jgi:phosphosulfolactate phosphohydrolase-like enzyme